jgi:hypothetical protein
MFVARSRYDQLRRQCDHEAAKREEAEQLAARREGSIVRLQGLVEEYRDRHPDGPVPTPKPGPESARVRQQLALAERARKALDAQCLQLHRVNLLQEHELCQLREQLAELQAVQQGVAS